LDIHTFSRKRNTGQSFSLGYILSMNSSFNFQDSPEPPYARIRIWKCWNGHLRTVAEDVCSFCGEKVLEICPYCEGMGYIVDPCPPTECPKCNGTGKPNE
jgi:hypothetical protein